MTGYDGPTGNGTPRAEVFAGVANPAVDSPYVFDASFYLARYGDHWVSTGIFEGRQGVP